jgi:hypothetical protein
MRLPGRPYRLAVLTLPRAAQPRARCLPAFGAMAWRPALRRVVERSSGSNLPPGARRGAQRSAIPARHHPEHRPQQGGPTRMRGAPAGTRGRPMAADRRRRNQRRRLGALDGRCTAPPVRLGQSHRKLDDSPNATLHPDRTIELGRSAAQLRQLANEASGHRGRASPIARAGGRRRQAPSHVVLAGHALHMP